MSLSLYIYTHILYISIYTHTYKRASFGWFAPHTDRVRTRIPPHIPGWLCCYSFIINILIAIIISTAIISTIIITKLFIIITIITIYYYYYYYYYYYVSS